MQSLLFATTNPDKVQEVQEYLRDIVTVEQFDYDYPEIQSDSLEPIAAHGAREAYHAAGRPVIVDDAGLFVEALGGFPGPYSAYVEDTLGIERVSTLARAEGEPRAAFRAVVAYADGGTTTAEHGDDSDTGSATTDPRIETFKGSVHGRIVEPRGEGGFGYDPIFEHGERTFAEMTAQEKNALSHRGRALERLAEWLATEQ